MDNRKRTRGRMRLTKDTSGQMSIDFLAGVAIFTLAFIYVFTFIPGMFTPFQSNSDELTMTADRVSTELVDNILLVDELSTSPNKFNNDRPNVIDASILEKFECDGDSDYNNDLNYNNERNLLGLSSNYKIHITLTLAASPNAIEYSTGQPEPISGAYNIGQSKRIIVLGKDFDETGITITKGTVGILTVTVW